MPVHSAHPALLINPAIMTPLAQALGTVNLHDVAEGIAGQSGDARKLVGDGRGFAINHIMGKRLGRRRAGNAIGEGFESRIGDTSKPVTGVI